MRRKFALGFLFLGVLAVGWVGLRYAFKPETAPSWENFRRLRVGMSEDSVIGLLGPPEHRVEDPTDLYSHWSIGDKRFIANFKLGRFGRWHLVDRLTMITGNEFDMGLKFEPGTMMETVLRWVRVL